MKKTIFWMAITFIATCVWMGCWFNTEVGNIRFLIGWSAFFGYFAFWLTNKKAKRVIDYIFDEILK